jgi:hypothetical protein
MQTASTRRGEVNLEKPGCGTGDVNVRGVVDAVDKSVPRGDVIGLAEGEPMRRAWELDS